jgi:hypothetical protein
MELKKIRVMKQSELQEIYENLNAFQVVHRCPFCEVNFYKLMIPVFYDDGTPTGELAYLTDFNPQCKFCGNIMERMDKPRKSMIDKTDMIKDTA